MLDYVTWVQRYPEAAADLASMLQTDPNAEAQGKSEAWALQQVRMQIARNGGRAWRNNVGATKAKEECRCPKCSFKFEVKNRVIRWGLANDSPQLNARIKSSDVIACVPRLIQPQHVGQTIGQFVAIEVKAPGWHYNPNDSHQAAQAGWLTLVASLGGYATFSTGGVQL